MSFYSANATKITKKSNGFKMLQLIIVKNGATKYECLTEALNKIGSKQKLRGYYSCYFRGLVDSGVVTLDYKTHKYNITRHGVHLFLEANER